LLIKVIKIVNNKYYIVDLKKNGILHTNILEMDKKDKIVDVTFIKKISSKKIIELKRI
jgi:hypothetical protein